MNKKKRKPVFIFTIILVLIVLYYTKQVSALKVSPGAFCVQNLDIGCTQDLGIDVVIENDTETEREFSLNIVQPHISELSTLQIYSPMPDPNWVFLGKNSLVVPAGGKGNSRLYVKIPGKESYYNQQWAVSCLVEYAEQKGLFQEAILTLYMVETKSKSDVINRPSGALAVSPIIIELNEKVGESEDASFKLYNNTSEERVYWIESFLPDSQSRNLNINVSPGFEWTENIFWINPKVKKVKLSGGEIKDIGVNIKMPKRLQNNKNGLEEIIFIESDHGDKRFIRVRLKK